MIESIYILVITAILLFVPPAERFVAHRRWRRTAQVDRRFTAAFPVVPPKRQLEQLVDDAEVVLESDRLLRGVRGVRRIYDRS